MWWKTSNEAQQQKKRKKTRNEDSVCFPTAFRSRQRRYTLASLGSSIHRYGPWKSCPAATIKSLTILPQNSPKPESFGWGRLWCWQKIRVWRRRPAYSGDQASLWYSTAETHKFLRKMTAADEAAWRRRGIDNREVEILVRFLCAH